jgi:hypothetical protein
MGDDASATTARYDQLGLGGSTMEGQDLGSQPSQTGGLAEEGLAMTGQLQTQNVANPALNPALQPQYNELLGASNNSTLSGLAGSALGAGLKAGIGAIA